MTDFILPRSVELKTHIQNKIDMLEDEFYIRLSLSEIEHFRSLTTESAVDQYAHFLLMDRL